MIKTAITGNIASGKSQVEKILADLGYKTADTDKINHFILDNDTETIEKIKEYFSDDDILNDNGVISREKLGNIVFYDEKKKIKLERILHKRIKEEVEKFFVENRDEKVVFVSVPVLFEAKQEDMYDKIVFISAKEDIRLKRLIKRNNYTIEQAKKRISAQEIEDKKIKKSDFIIYNNSDFDDLKNQVVNMLKSLFN